MAHAYQVLEMLIPEGGWVLSGNSYEGIEFIHCEPITKKQFTDGFAQYDAHIIEQAETKATHKAAAQAKLTALGLTIEDLQALGL